MSALVEKKTGFDGSRTLIQGGFCAWCKAGSIFAQDIEQSYNVKKVTKVKSVRSALNVSGTLALHYAAHLIEQFLVCRDSAVALRSASWRRFSPLRLQNQAGLGPGNASLKAQFLDRILVRRIHARA
jgi:hypothetical protein